MSAPSSSRIPTVLVVLVAALVAAGCALPGASRLEGPPEGLAPSLDYVTADVLGLTLFDTDPDSGRWAPLAAVAGEGQDNRVLQALHAPISGGQPADIDSVGSWIGDHAGVALRQLEVSGDERPLETAALYFADVRNREALEGWLQDLGWDEQGTGKLPGGPGEDLALWTNDWECGDTPRGAGVCATPEFRQYRALAVADDALVAARTRDGLESLLESAAAYAVPERRAMSRFAVEAADRVPVAFVYRFDLLRTQVRRPFQHDPALLEFARWATDSNALNALRDGWLGLAPGTEGSDDTVRVVGRAEWIPDLATGIELGPASRGRLGQLPANVDRAVAIDDPGQQLRELLRAVTFGAGQYATEQDVPEGERIELLPVLDALDGQAAVGWDADTRTLTMNVATADAAEVAGEVRAALEHGDVDGDAVPAGDGVLVTVTVPGAHASGGEDPDAGRSLDTSALATAGRPPREPVAWFWARGDECVGERAGWLTFDGTEFLSLSAGVRVDHGCFGDEDQPLVDDPLVGMVTIA